MMRVATAAPNTYGSVALCDLCASVVGKTRSAVACRTHQFRLPRDLRCAFTDLGSTRDAVRPALVLAWMTR